MLDEDTITLYSIIRHVVGKTPSYSDAKLNEDGLHPLQVKYGGWNEGFVDPDELHKFPLRELAPGVIKFLTDAAHLSRRDIRYISERLKLADRVESFDPKDTLSFYDALLDVVEINPWVMPTLEIEVVQNRTGAVRGKPGAQKAYRKRRGRILSKLMLSKLRLKNNEAIQKRLHEFNSVDPVPVDLWVGAFCEYAFDHHFRLSKTIPKRVFDMIYEMTLGNMSRQEQLEFSIRASEEAGDWSLPRHLITIQVEMARKDEVPFSGKEFSQLRKILRAYTHDIDKSTSSDAYNAISELAGMAAEMAELPDRANIDMITSILNKVGVEVREEDLDKHTVEMFCDPRILKLFHELCEAVDGLEEAKARRADLDASIAEATKARRYNQVRMLAKQAESVTAWIARVAEMHNQVESIYEAIMAGDRTTLNTLFEAEEAQEKDEAEDPGRDYKAQTNLHKPEPLDTEDTPRLPTDETDLQASAADIEDGRDEPMDRLVGTPQPTPVSEGDDQQTTVAVDQPGLGTDEYNLEMAKLEAATAPKARSEKEPYVETPLSPQIMPDLFDRGLLGLAADAADSLEAHRHRWPIEAVVLRAVAASRAHHGDYGPDTQRFLTIANRAATAVKSDAGASMLFGAFLRPAILQQNFSLRDSMPDMARGALGPHLKEVGTAIAELGFDFPPSLDTLAQLSGAPLAPQRQRIAERLEEWIVITSRKRSRWSFATNFMHHLVSSRGLIGKALTAINNDHPDVRSRVQVAIEKLDEGTDIEALAIEYAATTNRPSARLHSKGVEYLQRHFDEVIGLLSAWLAAVQRADTGSQRSEGRLRSIVASLHSRLAKARDSLAAVRNLSPLETAVARWLSLRLDEAITALNGSDTGEYATIEDALVAERDLLPTDVRRITGDPETLLNPLVDIFETTGIPAPVEAFDQALAQGAFEVAQRLAARHDLTASDARFDQQISRFTHVWIEGLETRQRRMKLLAKVDYGRQEEIARHLSWCESTLERLKVVAAGTGIDDLDDVPIYAAELDKVAKQIEANIRHDQLERIAKYRNEQNSEDATALATAIKDLALEAAEDRIAQLRDGRSAVAFDTELEGVIADFTPGFVTAASSTDWPKTLSDFELALCEDGLLSTDESRRAAALEFFGLYRELCTAIPKGKPSVAKIRAFFEEIGFEKVHINSIDSVGRTKSWRMNMSADLQSGSLSTSGWFLPPIFGSNAVSGYSVFLIGPDTLPEAVHKALDPKIPTILVLSGVANMAKRRDFAERLRATAIPAILIDEALAAFAATRRETRARTIFECGLPYGRVEPYITDAGQLPPEMFFGREAEIRSIMEKSSQGCLVYGGRQLGKSALLNHIAHTRHAPENHRIVVRHDVKMLGKADDTSKIWDYLKQMLSPDGVVRETSRDPEAMTQDIRTWLNARPDGQIVCLFDETDNFMDAETKADYPQLSRLKALMEDSGRSFKVVFAGLHNVRRMHRQPNSPLAHLGPGNCIGPLNQSEDDKRAAHDLVIAPMRAAGFRFESIEAVEEILA